VAETRTWENTATVMLHFLLHSSFFHSLLRHDRRNSLLSASFTSLVPSFTRSQRCVRPEMLREAVLQVSASLILITTHKITIVFVVYS
jgi:hypothetical protein